MRKFALLTALLCVAAPAGAQIVYNPSTLEFTSPDHVIVCPAEACVSGYTLEYWLQNVTPANGSPVTTASVSRDMATNVSGNVYRVNLADLSPIPAVPIGQTYVVRLIANGVSPEIKSARSEASNPFALAAAPRTPVSLTLR